PLATCTSGTIGAPPGQSPNNCDTPRGLYHARNRWYDARLGRFTSRDPNESAQPLLAALASNGAALDAMLGSFDAMALYGDGFSLYLFGRSNPLSGGDPLGLDWEGDYDIDDAMADRVGNAMYTIGTLNEMARVASIGLRTAVGIASSFLPGAGLYDAFQAVQVIASGQGGFWEALDIAGAAFPAMKLAGDGLTALRGLGRARGYAAKACRIKCFVAGTPVETPDGPIPIDCVHVGDWVVTKGEHDAAAPAINGRVTRVFKTIVPAVVWLTLSNGVQLGTTPGHEFGVAGQGWTYADSLQVGDALLTTDDTPIFVVDIALDRTPTTVYNLEIDGTATYFAGGILAHNNSCSTALRLTGRYVNHHTIPRQILDLLPRDVRNQMKGLRDDRKIIWKIDSAEHDALHGALGDGFRNSGSLMGNGGGAWNARWRAEMHARGKDLSTITLDELLQIRDRIAADFGLRPRQ
ncbi:MAG: hypothetical protein JNG88_18145, partial [Phycisphaerales bacterium]|nr:hypothetical protein [Phycisphaerales bacterium]